MQFGVFDAHAARLVRASGASPRREDVHVLILPGEVLDCTGEEKPRKLRAQAHSAAPGIGVPGLGTTAAGSWTV